MFHNAKAQPMKNTRKHFDIDPQGEKQQSRKASKKAHKMAVKQARCNKAARMAVYI